MSSLSLTLTLEMMDVFGDPNTQDIYVVIFLIKSWLLKRIERFVKDLLTRSTQSPR